MAEKNDAGQRILQEYLEEITLPDTYEGLDILYEKKWGENVPEDLKESISDMIKLLESNSQLTAKMLENFSASQKLVKMHRECVPLGVLPFHYTATLHDMKVDARGPDDEIYNKNPEIRKMIARGTTTMELQGKESTCHDVVIYANKKFTGGVGDEDENQPHNDDVWREYCLEPPENAVKIICMEKLNGDAVHFSGRFIDGRFYLIAGSKNVHMLLGKKSDIDLYEGSRYQSAKMFAATVFDTFANLSVDERRVLFGFLHHTKVTAICEVLQPKYQHIVNLSHLKENELNFITFTPTAFREKETTLTAFPPHLTLKLGAALGLVCAQYTEIKPTLMMNQRDKIRAYHNKEGEVLYYLNQDGKTFGIAKAKSVWYICLRALREKAVYTFTSKKGKSDWNLEDRIKSVHKRYTEIQNWLKISEQCLRSWKSLGESFMRWLDKEVRRNNVDPKSIRPDFPVIWKRFLEEDDKDDQIQL
ncbi:uncharacterized protein [Palaemon carinicauda]|uniref:uncharacterized protein isoform X2 n=1 Tax=Palaemon carinicauda TaxID=392227 RepID=UPI0035B6AAFC